MLPHHSVNGSCYKNYRVAPVIAHLSPALDLSRDYQNLTPGSRVTFGTQVEAKNSQGNRTRPERGSKFHSGFAQLPAGHCRVGARRAVVVAHLAALKTCVRIRTVHRAPVMQRHLTAFVRTGSVLRHSCSVARRRRSNTFLVFHRGPEHRS